MAAGPSSAHLKKGAGALAQTHRSEADPRTRPVWRQFAVLTILACCATWESIGAAERPHSLQTEFPGRVQLDAWGWQGQLYYQREPHSGVGPEYIRQRIIDESFKWGANLLELYPAFFHPVSWPMRWEADDPLPKPDGYDEHPDPRWPRDAFIALTRHAHQRGMLVHWFCHPQLVARSGHPGRIGDPEATELNSPAAEWLTATFADALTMDAADVLDGSSYGQWSREDGGRTSAPQWRYNPGMYGGGMAECPRNPAASFVRTLMAAADRGLRGRDDQQGLPIDLGAGFLACQADCRPLRPREDEWDRWARHGRGTYPDWIVKQANDFSRRRIAADGKPDATAIWWLGEPESTLPAAIRPYVYIASQDPMRSVVAMRLWTTGAGGYIDTMRQLHGHDWAPRYDVPAATACLQNNYIRACRLPEEDAGKLLYDPTGTAHFDSDSKCVTLSAGFLSLRLSTTAPPEAQVVLGIGSWDGSSGELQPRVSTAHGDTSAYAAVAEFRPTSQRASRMPAGLADDLSLPATLRLRLHLGRGAYTLRLGQLPTDTAHLLRVSVDGALVGWLVVDGDGISHVRNVPFQIGATGEHALEVSLLEGCGFEFDALDIVKRSAHPVLHAFPEPGGHVAVLSETVTARGEHGHLTETRRYTAVADAPYLRVDVQRRTSGRVKEATWVINCDAYDTLTIASEAHTTSAVFTESIPRIMVLRTGARAAQYEEPYEPIDEYEDEYEYDWDDDGDVAADAPADDHDGQQVDEAAGVPALAIMLLNPGRIAEVSWTPRRELALRSRSPDREKLSLAFVPLGGLYRAEHLDDLGKLLGKAHEPITVPVGGSVTITNDAWIPLVREVRLSDAGSAPYFVKEAGADEAGSWWMFRGAQPSGERSGSDWLRVYLQPRGEAAIQRYGFIDGVARPGWGCQYTMALRDLAAARAEAKCTARVLSVTPYIFAPRVQFAVAGRRGRAIADATVNGQPWRYFGDDAVFLPNRPGEYSIEVEFGKPKLPRLLRTYACVDRAALDGEDLIVAAALPPWTDGLPGQLRFTALVDGGTRTIREAIGGEVLRSTPDRRRAIIAFTPGALRVHARGGR